jgi:hypothetical protein
LEVLQKVDEGMRGSKLKMRKFAGTQSSCDLNSANDDLGRSAKQAVCRQSVNDAQTAPAGCFALTKDLDPQLSCLLSVSCKQPRDDSGDMSCCITIICRATARWFCISPRESIQPNFKKRLSLAEMIGRNGVKEARMPIDSTGPLAFSAQYLKIWAQ